MGPRICCLQKPFPREVNRSLYNTLADALWNFGMRGRAARVVQLGRQQKVHPEERVLYGLPTQGGPGTGDGTGSFRNGQGRRKGAGLAVLGWGGGLGAGASSGSDVEEEEDEMGGVWSVDLHEHSLGSGAAFLFCWLGEIRQVWKVSGPGQSVGCNRCNDCAGCSGSTHLRSLHTLQ